MQPPMHAVLLYKILEPETGGDNADGADNGGFLRMDRIARAGEPVTARRRHILDECINRQIFFFGKPPHKISNQ